MEGELEVLKSDLNQENLEISLDVITGSHNPKTMRVKRKIGATWVTVLINTGSTHNFLDLSIVLRSKLPLDITKTVKVKVSSGELFPSEGKS